MYRYQTDRFISGALQNLIKSENKTIMATNPPTGDGHRKGAVRSRTQVHNPHTDRWVKRDADNGRFMDQKADPKPFKGVRREK